MTNNIEMALTNIKKRVMNDVQIYCPLLANALNNDRQ